MVPPADTGFDVVRRGYDQAQVDAHLHRIDAEIRILATDRAAAVDQAAQLTRELDDSRARAERMRAQVRTLVSPRQNVTSMSERMRSMLRLAEDEVGEMLAHAETEVSKRLSDADVRAEQVLEAARAEAEAIRVAATCDAEEYAQERAKVLAEITAERQTCADGIAAAEMAAAERAEAWAESEARRKLVEEDFTIAMDQRRAEALSALKAARTEARRAIDEMKESSAAQARQEVLAARGQARRIIAMAEQRASDLLALRRRLVEQLHKTRLMLEQSTASLDLLRDVDPSDSMTTPPNGTPMVVPPSPRRPSPGRRASERAGAR